MTIHIMLDLETWGTEPGCDIRSIGACVFDPLYGYVAEPSGDEANDSKSFYIATDNPTPPALAHAMTIPKLEPCFIDDVQYHWDEGSNSFRKYPLRRDPRTVKWWSDQSAEAQAAFANPVDMREALISFAVWLEQRSTKRPFDFLHYPDGINKENVIWAHGPAFDVSILAAAYRAVGLPIPWHYRAPRDTRTAFDMAGIHDDDDGSYRTFMSAYNTGTYHHALDDAIAQAKSVCGAYQRAGIARRPVVDDPWIAEILKLNASFAPTARDEQILFHHMTVGDVRRIAPLFMPRAVTITNPSTLTTAENAIRDATLEQAASVCEGITSWGLPPTKLAVAESTQRFCAKAIRAQKSDSPQRIAHEAKDNPS